MTKEKNDNEQNTPVVDTMEYIKNNLIIYDKDTGHYVPVYRLEESYPFASEQDIREYEQCVDEWGMLVMTEDRAEQKTIAEYNSIIKKCRDISNIIEQQQDDSEEMPLEMFIYSKSVEYAICLCRTESELADVYSKMQVNNSDPLALANAIDYSERIEEITDQAIINSMRIYQDIAFQLKMQGGTGKNELTGRILNSLMSMSLTLGLDYVGQGSAKKVSSSDKKRYYEYLIMFRDIELKHQREVVDRILNGGDKKEEGIWKHFSKIIKDSAAAMYEAVLGAGTIDEQLLKQVCEKAEYNKGNELLFDFDKGMSDTLLEGLFKKDRNGNIERRFDLSYNPKKVTAMDALLIDATQKDMDMLLKLMDSGSDTLKNTEVISSVFKRMQENISEFLGNKGSKLKEPIVKNMLGLQEYITETLELSKVTNEMNSVLSEFYDDIRSANEGVDGLGSNILGENYPLYREGRVKYDNRNADFLDKDNEKSKNEYERLRNELAEKLLNIKEMSSGGDRDFKYDEQQRMLSEFLLTKVVPGQENAGKKFTKICNIGDKLYDSVINGFGNYQKMLKSVAKSKDESFKMLTTELEAMKNFAGKLHKPYSREDKACILKSLGMIQGFSNGIIMGDGSEAQKNMATMIKEKTGFYFETLAAIETLITDSKKMITNFENRFKQISNVKELNKEQNEAENRKEPGVVKAVKYEMNREKNKEFPDRVLGNN